MSIKLNCPRCKKSLSVPNKKAGAYANCPACNGRFWVPDDAATDGTTVEAMVASPAVPMALPPGAPLPAATPPTTPPGAPAGASRYQGSPLPSAAPEWTPSPASAPGIPSPPPTMPAAPPAPPAAPVSLPSGLMRPAPVANPPAPALPQAPAGLPATAPTPRSAMTPAASAWSLPTVPVPAAPLPPAAPSGVPLPSPQRRTARLISADAAQSTLKLAADGKLPELQLEEDKEKKKMAEEEGSSMNPLVLFGALTLSVAMSIGMVLMDSSAPKADGGLERTKAREMIETDYFGGGPLERGKQLLPYQEMLRDAHREHLRGNYRAERKLYQKVLNLLRAERGRNDSGLTGSTLRDRILENQLLILLSEG